MTSETIALAVRSPKAELHLHIEGTLEPEMLLILGERNGISVPYADVDAARAAYQFDSLQTFLDIYYQGAAVLQTAQDFHDLTWAYLNRAAADNVCHTEVFFDPQTHTERGIAFDAVVEGVASALDRGKRELAISSRLIMCFLRHLSEGQAEETLDMAQRHLDVIYGVGLDSSEMGNPPSKFERVFTRARNLGLRAVAHAGEEGPPTYIHESLELLEVERIDHGVRCDRDDGLMRRLAQTRMPLTVCPLSNVALGVFSSLEDHNLARLLDAGLCVTVNSDDPAYFGGYINKNLTDVIEALQLSTEQARRLIENSFEASFLDDGERATHFAAVKEVFAGA
jgi:adenine deaminase